MTLARLVLLSLLVTIADQLSKWYVWTHLPYGEAVPALGSLFSWTYCHNTGGAFSILAGSRWFFLLAGTVISLYLMISLPRMAKGHPIPAICYALILGGAIGNMIDRALYGYVVDFIDFHWWPVFNVADSAITVGISVLAICILFGKDQPK